MGFGGAMKKGKLTIGRRALLRMLVHGLTASPVALKASSGAIANADVTNLEESFQNLATETSRPNGHLDYGINGPSEIVAEDYARFVEDLVTDPWHEPAWAYEATLKDESGKLIRGDRVRGSWAVLYEGFLYHYYQRRYERSAEPQDRERAQRAAEYALIFAGWWSRGVSLDLPPAPPTPQPANLDLTSGFGEGCQFVWWGCQWLRGSPERDGVEQVLREVSESCLQSYLPYIEFGANNRTFFAAIWYEIALSVGAFSGNPTLAEALRTYAQAIWDYWYPYREHEEDDAHYGITDLMQLSTWLAVRGLRIEDDPALASFWAQIAAHIMNDGTWPAYGSGPIAPVDGLVRAIVVAEDAARATRDGVYKTLGHRSFWFFLSHLDQLLSYSYFEYEAIFLTFAYMAADETVKERQLPAQPTVTTRRAIRRAEEWPSNQPYFFEQGLIESKVIMRSGHQTDDLCLFIQGRDKGGHGRPDVPAILWMGQGHSTLLYNGVARLDTGMRFQNMVNVQDPDYPDLDLPWTRTSYARTRVSASGFTSKCSFTQIEVTGDPAFPATPERWEAIRTGNVPTYGHPRAIGYNNYPAETTRIVFMVHNRFVLVYDQVRFTLGGYRFRVGPNWVSQTMDNDRGENWVNTRIESMYGDEQGLRRSPLKNAQRDLLIWFAPAAGSVLVRQNLNEGRPNPDDPYQIVINTGQRAWYREEKIWVKDETRAFASLLWPHPPAVSPISLANSVRVIEQTSLCSIIVITDSNGDEEIVWVNQNQQQRRILMIETDAAAGYAVFRKGRFEHLSCIRATNAKVNGVPLPINADGIVDVAPSSILHFVWLPLV